MCVPHSAGCWCFSLVPYPQVDSAGRIAVEYFGLPTSFFIATI